MPHESSGSKMADGGYRALLDVLGAIATHSTFYVVLHSLRALLSSVVSFESVTLLVIEDGRETLRVFAFDRASDELAIEIGMNFPYTGTALERAMDEQQPVYVPDAPTEMLKIPQLAALASAAALRSAYVFPVSTSRKKIGALVFGRTEGAEFSAEDMEVLSSTTSRVAVALESALANDRAESYQRQLGQERDRLRLLLEINNHVVSKLYMDDLFRAASASIRKYFANDFTGFFVIDKQTNRLHCAVLDFPSGRGLLTEVPGRELIEEDLDRLRARMPEIWSFEEMIENVARPVRASLITEEIREMAVAPLVTATGPLGAITLGSRKAKNFSQADLELLSQIGAQIALALDNALAYGRLNASNARLEEERLYLESEIRSETNFEDIVGKSTALRKVLDEVAIVAPTDSTVLLHGETGTGKELVARAIHKISLRRDRTFVRLNCAAIPSGLVESELFGHEKGAFTGALMQKRGRFELADHGTLFLDEIGDISLELQPKLLRSLQEREFERLGSAKTIHIDVRLIAATHRDLPAMIRNNQFREDLFYRLNVFPIEIPPLRERREDIPLLVHYFVSRLSRRMQKQIKSIPKQAMEALVRADWPGNIRELENFVERCVILTQGGQLNVPCAELKRSPTGSSVTPLSTFEQAERQVIIHALIAASGKIAGKGGAAERLGLKRTTLQTKMQRLNITRSDY